MEDTKTSFEEKLIEVMKLQQKMHHWNLIMMIIGIIIEVLIFIMLMIIFIK